MSNGLGEDTITRNVTDGQTDARTDRRTTDRLWYEINIPYFSNEKAGITNTEPHNGSNNQQRINNNRIAALERTSALATGGLNAFNWHQIFALNSVVVKAQNIVKLAWRLPNYCNVSPQRNNLIKLTPYDETKKMAHARLADSQS